MAGASPGMSGLRMDSGSTTANPKDIEKSKPTPPEVSPNNGQAVNSEVTTEGNRTVQRTWATVSRNNEEFKYIFVDFEPRGEK